MKVKRYRFFTWLLPLQSYKRLLAYKMVVKKYAFEGCTNYKAALNDFYSLHSMKHEIRQILQDIDPQNIRRRRTEELVLRSQKRYLPLILCPWNLMIFVWLSEDRAFNSDWHLAVDIPARLLAGVFVWRKLFISRYINISVIIFSEIWVCLLEHESIS